MWVSELTCVHVLRKVLVHIKLQKWWQWAFHATHKGNSHTASNASHWLWLCESQLPGFPVCKIAFKLVWIWDCKIHLFPKTSRDFCGLKNEVPWHGMDLSSRFSAMQYDSCGYKQWEAKKTDWRNGEWIVSCIWKGEGQIVSVTKKSNVYKHVGLSLW